MKEQDKETKMVFKNHFKNLPKDSKRKIRDEFCERSGVILPTFYNKLRENSFKALEVKLMSELVQKYS